MTDRHPCQSCSAPATLFICARCSTEMKAQLQSLAYGPKRNGHSGIGLLEALSDVELKRSKLGGGAGGHRQKGDERPDPFIPDIDKMKDGRPVPSPQGRAATLILQARNTLTTITRDLCESRGIDQMRAFRVVPYNFAGPLMPGWKRALSRCWNPSSADIAQWLAGAVNAMACDESAGQWRAEIDVLVREIQRVIDRPVKIETLGFCITQVGNGTCDTALRAPEGAIEVRCRKCRTTRRCDTVRAQAQSDARRALIPWEKVLETNKTQPEGWRVNERTLRDWKATGALKPHYLRPDGTHGQFRRHEDDTLVYRWADIERLRTHSVPRGDRKRTRAGR